jgi:biotin/methionine sulfoxide reductase
MNLVVPWREIVEHTRLVVMFGGAHSKNRQIDAGGAVTHDGFDWTQKARMAGVRFITISPSRDDVVGNVNSTWVPVRPNTDMALMLGIAHTFAINDLHDKEFLANHCVGYGAFARYLLGLDDGQPKSAAWAAKITGVDAEVITDLAHQIICNRTLITTSWSVQRADHGEQPVWMTIVLAAMAGQIGLPGGGFSLGFGATNSISSPHPISMPKPTMPLGENKVKLQVPVGRVADMLLRPGEELEYNGATIRLPDIKFIYSVGGNPFHHNTNLNRFLRAWQRPEVVVVHEPWWNPAAKHADIVLPATTTLERNDILAADGQRYVVAMRQVMEPVGQARNDFDIFSELAEQLGFGAAYTEGRSEMGWLRHMYETARSSASRQGLAAPDFDEFWERGYFELPIVSAAPTLLEEFRSDPGKHPLTTPSGLIEIFSSRIEGFQYDDCPPHPTWIEPSEWLGGPGVEQFPFHLVSNQPSTRLHSQLDIASVSVKSKVRQREPIAIHAEDARARGISAGDVVRVYNNRGSFLAGAVLVDHLLRGVLQIATGAWFDPETPGLAGSLEKHGNPNVVTQDSATSRLAQAPAAQTVLVQIEKYLGNVEVTAFQPPGKQVA